MSSDHDTTPIRSDPSGESSAPGATPPTELGDTLTAEQGADRPWAGGAPAQAGHEPVTIDAELEAARNGVLDAIAAWLVVAWEQPILRALSANTPRALGNATAFPALRRALVELQADARETVERNVAPLLDPEVPTSDQSLTRSIDEAIMAMVGLIGAPLKDATFDAHSGGLVRVHDGYRLATMTDDDQIRVALQRLSEVKSARAAERAEVLALELELARVEVDRLWQATAVDG